VRIIGGSLKGRKLNPPNYLPVRPTTDFAREALFNILNHKIDLEGINSLDLFSGTGAISIELLSRGSAFVQSVDVNKHCLIFLNNTCKEFGIEAKSKSLRTDIIKWLKQKPEGNFDLIFADPPYDLPELIDLPDLILQANLLNANALLVVEHPKKIDFKAHPNFLEHRNYGNVNFSLFLPIISP
jgi:16S rRNA (guanine966-N2)-methyltransferase